MSVADALINHSAALLITHDYIGVRGAGANSPSGSALCLCQDTCPPQVLHRSPLRIIWSDRDRFN